MCSHVYSTEMMLQWLWIFLSLSSRISTRNMNTQVIRRIKNVIRCRDNGTALSKKTRWCIELVGLVCASVMVHVGSYVVPLLIILYCLTKWHIDAPLIWLDVIIHYLQVHNVLTKLIKHSSVTWQTKTFLLRWRHQCWQRWVSSLFCTVDSWLHPWS